MVVNFLNYYRQCKHGFGNVSITMYEQVFVYEKVSQGRTVLRNNYSNCFCSKAFSRNDVVKDRRRCSKIPGIAEISREHTVAGVS